jgi:hypothetical protein
VNGVPATARIAVRLAVTLALVYAMLGRGHFLSTDEVSVYQVMRSIWEEGNLAIAPGLAHSSIGRDGHAYAAYSTGQSLAALPLYGLGRSLDLALGAVGGGDWLLTLAGPVVGQGDMRWAGDVGILFVSYFNAFTVATLAAVFFAFALRLGATPGAALATSALLAFASYIAPFSTSFFQHPAEALFLLWAAYFLVTDAQRPDRRLRAAAGAMASLGLLFRLQAAVALPAFGLYLLWNVWRRTRAGDTASVRLAAAARQVLPFAIAVALGLGLHVLFNYLKSGRVTLVAGDYAHQHFDTPILRGLHGLLLSPGHSLLLFTPLLLLVPTALRHLTSRHRPEALLIVAVTASYLWLYAGYDFWHGLWCFGPRYLAAIVPLLLVPLAPWIAARGRQACLLVVPFGLAGLWMQTIHFAVNFWRVTLRESYPMGHDEWQRADFLFLPDVHTPVVAFSRAFLAGDDRVDLRLLELAREGAPGTALVLTLGFLVSIAIAARGLVRELRAARAPGEVAPSFAPLLRPAALVLGVGAVLLALGFAADRRHRVTLAAAIRRELPAEATEAEVMAAGIDALYRRRQPDRAAFIFRDLLERRPDHYGATYQLARALETWGLPHAAGDAWRRTLRLAIATNDAPVAAVARARIREPAPRRPGQ